MERRVGNGERHERNGSLKRNATETAACTAGTNDAIASFTPAPLKGRWGIAGGFCALHMDMFAPHL